jgi:hypothetical protein
VPGPDDFIDPQQFLGWQRQLPLGEAAVAPAIGLAAALIGTDGSRHRYGVLPVRAQQGTDWYDAAGFALAHTLAFDVSGDSHRSDFELRTDGGVRIERAFEWRSARAS